MKEQLIHLKSYDKERKLALLAAYDYGMAKIIDS